MVILYPKTFNLNDGNALQRITPLQGQFDNDNSFVDLERLPPLRTAARLDRESKLNVSASRREKCRINQARYRTRKRQHADELDKSIQQLQNEIQDLEAKRQVIEQSASITQSVWVVATDYFRHFRHGFKAPSGVSNSLFAYASRPYQPHPQLEFLRTTMVEDVTDGCLCGAEALLENWRLLSLFHGDVSVELTSLQQVSGGSLLAATSVSLTITENTLCHLYPHLIKVGADGQELSPIAVRMLNQRIVVPGSVRFDWDSVSCRVARLESRHDMATPMLKLLGSLQAMACVFDQAGVTLEGHIVQ